MAGKDNKAFSRNKHSFRWFICLAIIAITAFVFRNVTKGEWLYNWDDNIYILDSPNVYNFSLKGIFTQYEVDNYHPITTLSYAIQKKAIGLNASSFHLWNLLSHLLNVFLVYRLIHLLTKDWKITAITTLLFAIHPMRVESVAWIAERKDVLYIFFYLLALISYVVNKINRTRQHLNYTLVLFLCSLLSKSAAVSFPLILVLIDYYFDSKVDFKAVLRKWPFFLLSLVFGIIAIHSQSTSGAIRVAPEFSFLDRLLIINYNLIFYVLKYFVPTNLSVIYLYPQKVNGLLPVTFYWCPVFTFLLILLPFLLKQLKKEILFALGFYLIGLILVLQIIPVGRAITADRYSYLPHIGMSFLVANVFMRVKYILQNNKLLSVLILLAMVSFSGMCCYLSAKQINVWKNSVTVTTNAVEANQGAFLYKDYVYASRGVAMDKMQDYVSAIKDYDKALEFNPNYDKVYFNRAFDKEKIKDYSGALVDYSKAVEVNPSYAKAYFSRGTLKINTNDLVGAVQDFDFALKYDSGLTEAYNNRGAAKYMNNQKEEACKDWFIAASKGYKNAQLNIEKYCKND